MLARPAALVVLQCAIAMIDDARDGYVAVDEIVFSDASAAGRSAPAEVPEVSGLSASASRTMSGLTLSSSARACSQKSVGTSAATSQRKPSRSYSRSQNFSMSIM